jgi:prophage DNA circulation protein
MTKADLNEAVSATIAVLGVLLATLGGVTGTAGAQLLLAVSALETNAGAELIAGAQFWSDLANCFELARIAGSSFAAMDAVRAAAEALTPAGLPAIAIKNFCVRLALAEEGQILAATNFTSRQQIDRLFDQINLSFECAIVVAADNQDNIAYEALIALYAAVSNDLANRAQPLPRLVRYDFPLRMAALSLAQRLYQDPTRYGQLIAENNPIHPLFMMQRGFALSS